MTQQYTWQNPAILMYPGDYAPQGGVLRYGDAPSITTDPVGYITDLYSKNTIAFWLVGAGLAAVLVGSMMGK